MFRFGLTACHVIQASSQIADLLASAFSTSPRNDITYHLVGFSKGIANLTSWPADAFQSTFASEQYQA